jgi:hypothetical protein
MPKFRLGAYVKAESEDEARERVDVGLLIPALTRRPPTGKCTKIT